MNHIFSHSSKGQTLTFPKSQLAKDICVNVAPAQSCLTPGGGRTRCLGSLFPVDYVTLQCACFPCKWWVFSPTEQHAVQELTKASMSGVAIDGEVLSYLELAQVSVHSLLKIFWSAAGLAFSSPLVLSIASKWLKVCSSENAWRYTLVLSSILNKVFSLVQR